MDQPLATNAPVLPDDAHLSKRFCFAFMALLSLMLLGVAVTNFVVNPYGQYATHWFQPVVQMSRQNKLELLKASPAPEGLVLGSSRTLKLEPQYLSAATGLQFFNAGVNYAQSEDHLALYRHVKSVFGKPPKMVVLGLDVASFAPAVRPDARLLSNANLVAYIPDAISWVDRFHRWKELLAWHQLKESLRTTKLNLQDAIPDPTEEYRADGFLVYLQREREISAGTYDFQGPLDFTKHEYKTKFAAFNELSQRRLELFRTLARECQQDQTTLVVFLTTLHPELRNHLVESTPYTKRKSELLTALQRLSGECAFRLTDLTDHQSYGGDPTQFVDGIHPLEQNTRRMIDVMLANTKQPAIEPAAGKTKYALQ